MTKTVLQTIRNGVMVIGVCASLAAGSLGFGGSAEARVPEGDRVSESARLCGGIQDLYDAYYAEMVDPKTTLDRWIEVKEHLSNLIALWKNSGCQGWYGGIAGRVLVPSFTKNQEAVEPSNTAEVSPISRQLAGAAMGGMVLSSGQ